VEGRPLDDNELVERARQGDMSAYEILVQRHQVMAIRVAYVICGDEAEDAAQDAFVKAWRALGRFRESAPFRPWLLRIVCNEARNRRRSSARRSRLALRRADDRPSADAAPSAEEVVLAAQGRRLLLDAVNNLPDRDREVVACRHLLGLSEAETAAVLGWPRGTVKSRLARALARLRASLSEAEPEAAPETGGRP
jgi:RNA polymerase sigma factor (sigma-70 family)